MSQPKKRIPRANSKSRSKELVSNVTTVHETAEYVEKNSFGGWVGAVILILWSHYILYYFWYCIEKEGNNGMLILPISYDSFVKEIASFKVAFLKRCIPDIRTCFAYLSFFVCQIILAAIVPGITVHGLPIGVPPKQKTLKYLCNGYLCYYICIWGFFLMHFLSSDEIPYVCDKDCMKFFSVFNGFYKGTHLAENLGKYLTLAIIVSDVTSIFWYLYGLSIVEKEEITGNVIYDFFMGTILNPRIGIVDIKMVAECRWSWLTLMLLTISCALKQLEVKGFITKEMGMMILAHLLYSNATVKGEHYIPCTWDMFHERFGWMLNFWNIAGVPYLYCFASFYILKNENHTLPLSFAIFLYVMLLIGYYIFDTANCQKASCKLRGIVRNTFPQLPWGVLQEPIRYIETPKGKLLIDGWYAYARKMQYTGDIIMSLCWGLVCGFKSLTPYFYFAFFLGMITHRQTRDEARCKEKYREYWDVYTKEVPSVFIPNFYKMYMSFTRRWKKLPSIKCDHTME